MKSFWSAHIVLLSLVFTVSACSSSGLKQNTAHARNPAAEEDGLDINRARTQLNTLGSYVLCTATQVETAMGSNEQSYAKGADDLMTLVEQVANGKKVDITPVTSFGGSGGGHQNSYSYKVFAGICYKIQLTSNRK